MTPEAKKELALLFISLMEEALEQISNDPELMSGLLDRAQSVDDWLQEKLGKVNTPKAEESIQLAIETSVVRDKRTICSIIAVITTLYTTRNVVRGANVGGTLLNEFGDDVFPHIDSRELRFAKPVNPKLKTNIEYTITNSFDETLAKYDFQQYADFANVGSGQGYASWTSASYVGVYGFTKMLLNFGPQVLRAVKSILRVVDA